MGFGTAVRFSWVLNGSMVGPNRWNRFSFGTEIFLTVFTPNRTINESELFNRTVAISSQYFTLFLVIFIQWLPWSYQFSKSRWCCILQKSFVLESWWNWLRRLVKDIQNQPWDKESITYLAQNKYFSWFKKTCHMCVLFIIIAVWKAINRAWSVQQYICAGTPVIPVWNVYHRVDRLESASWYDWSKVAFDLNMGIHCESCYFCSHRMKTK